MTRGDGYQKPSGPFWIASVSPTCAPHPALEPLSLPTLPSAEQGTRSVMSQAFLRRSSCTAHGPLHREVHMGAGQPVARARPAPSAWGLLSCLGMAAADVPPLGFLLLWPLSTAVRGSVCSRFLPSPSPGFPSADHSFAEGRTRP